MLTRDPEVAVHILRKNHRNYFKSDITSHHLGKYIGYGLLTLNGNEWREDRRLLQPGFYKKRIEQLYNHTIPKTVATTLDRIPVGKTVDIHSFMNELAFEVVTNALFDVQIGELLLREIRQIIDSVQLYFVKEVRQPQWNIFRKLLGRQAKVFKQVKRIRQIMNGLIEARLQSDSVHEDLLDLMLNSSYEDGAPMERERIIDELIILIVAGHETTANGLNFMVHQLAQKPKILQKVKEEVQAVAQEHLSPYEQLSQMNYGRAVVQETLRKYPPAWIIDRKALKPDQVGETYIPAETLIAISIIELHHNPDYWKLPEKFDPDRFLSPPPPVYIPFGIGPRMCIGNHFALFEMIEVLRQLALRFQLSTSQKDLNQTALITLQPSEAINIHFDYA